MLAEYQKFNGNWFKDCGKCKKPYGAENIYGLFYFFNKDKSRSDGFDAICKECRKKYRKINSKKEKLRWNRYYAPGTDARKRHIIRSQTRKKYGSAKKLNCKKYGNKANEWHHLEYKKEMAIPLCHKCHELIHLEQ